MRQTAGDAAMAIAIDGASQLRASLCRCDTMLDEISLGPETYRIRYRFGASWTIVPPAPSPAAQPFTSRTIFPRFGEHLVSGAHVIQRQEGAYSRGQPTTVK